MADWWRVSPSPASIPDVLLIASIGDPDGTRTVISIVALLVAIGVALVLLAVWVYRTTRPDPELLAPLEVMGERSWRRGDPVWQRRRLDELRPPGACLSPSKEALSCRNLLPAPNWPRSPPSVLNPCRIAGRAGPNRLRVTGSSFAYTAS